MVHVRTIKCPILGPIRGPDHIPVLADRGPDNIPVLGPDRDPAV